MKIVIDDPEVLDEMLTTYYDGKIEINTIACDISDTDNLWFDLSDNRCIV